VFFQALVLTVCLAGTPAGSAVGGEQAIETDDAAVLPQPSDTVAAGAVGTSPPRLYRLRVSRPLTASVAASGGAMWLGTELLGKPALRPLTCRWCDRDAQGVDTLGGFDRFGRMAAWAGADGQKTAARLSDALGFLGVPLAVGGAGTWLAHRNGVLPEASTDLLIIAEAAVVSAVANQMVKFLVRRERPFVHVLPEDLRLSTHDPNDNNLSFYSGHTSFVFALAASAGMVAELRGYQGRWLVWAVGMPLAAATGYLRMAADKHYLSDVLVGAVMGSAFGVGMPLLLHRRAGLLEVAPTFQVDLVPQGNGVALVGSF
jgi:membrane-associated phospholipid phosphatase